MCQPILTISKGSEDTKRLYGANAKAKANATQGIPMLLQCATNRRWQENFKGKHNVDAKFGWYRFTTRFALPVYNNDTGDLERRATAIPLALDGGLR